MKTRGRDSHVVRQRDEGGERRSVKAGGNTPDKEHAGKFFCLLDLVRVAFQTTLSRHPPADTVDITFLRERDEESSIGV